MAGAKVRPRLLPVLNPAITKASDCHHRRLHRDRAYTCWEMRYLRAITFGVMLIAWGSGSAAACLLPDSQLTEEEKACCREMASQCGEEMQASHSCCTKSVKHDQSPLTSRGHDLRPELAIARLAADEEGSSPLGAVIPIGWLTSPSPPGPAPGATTILRI